MIVTEFMSKHKSEGILGYLAYLLSYTHLNGGILFRDKL